MYDHVDYFVIAESSLTHSNQNKPLTFKENAGRFARFNDKIKYIEVPPVPQKDSWEGEFFQRNHLKNALINCDPDDLIIIADIDELVNMEYIQKEIPLTKPALVEMSVYYYFLNLKTSINWLRTLISPYQYIKDFNIGDRLKYAELKPEVIRSQEVPLGWHFSYMFGYDVSLYISKLISFSHQEFNTPYYLDPKRIHACISLGVDFLERNSVYSIVDLRKEVTPKLYNAIIEAGVKTKLIYRKPAIAFYFNFYHIKYYLKFRLKPQLKSWLDKQIFKRVR